MLKQSWLEVPRGSGVFERPVTRSMDVRIPYDTTIDERSRSSTTMTILLTWGHQVQDRNDDSKRTGIFQVERTIVLVCLLFILYVCIIYIYIS